MVIPPRWQRRLRGLRRFAGSKQRRRQELSVEEDRAARNESNDRSSSFQALKASSAALSITGRRMKVAVGLDTDDGETVEQGQRTPTTVWRLDLGGSIFPTIALWRHPAVGNLNGGGATPEFERVRAAATGSE
ncbi:unnamed protein product [Lactuca virosa]|uniref:Uncharacterized protein n=1 Tax=Lactuca virosa TaxID=75947 RepID=A0AAU9NQ41_9ASTR|nr:unnamed protein product [Lactuca virosa]